MGNGITAEPGNMKRGLQGFAFLALIICFNLLLFAGTSFLIERKLLAGGSFFISLVLFLSLALSVAILVIVALGERIRTENIDNEWIKKIGVTPIFVIVAVLIAIAMSFSALAEKIMPVPGPVRPQFMLADLGVTCVTKNENKSPQASSLLTVVSSAEEEYVKKVNEFLHDKNFMQFANNQDFTIVKKDAENPYYRLLHQYARSSEQGAEALAADLRHGNTWIAYTVKVEDPRIYTFVPIPTMFEKSHRTRLYVVTIERDMPASGESDPTPNPVAGQEVSQNRILPLFEVNLFSKQAAVERQLTKLDFEVSADHICWHIGR